MVAMITYIGFILSYTFNMFIICYAGEFLVEEVSTMFLAFIRHAFNDRYKCQSLSGQQTRRRVVRDQVVRAASKEECRSYHADSGFKKTADTYGRENLRNICEHFQQCK